jgi:hypothetical protein
VVGNGGAAGGPHGDEGVELCGCQVEDCAATAQAHTTAQVGSQGVRIQKQLISALNRFLKKEIRRVIE